MRTAATIAQTLSAYQAADAQSALRQWWWLWIALVLLGLVLIRVVAAFGKRRRNAARFGPAARKRPRIKDAWEEAGRRIEPIQGDEPPSESSP